MIFTGAPSNSGSEEYEAMIAEDPGRLLHKRIRAMDLWRKMLSMLFETGHPWITFKDSCNIRSPQQHVGVVHSSNLCTEITLNTSADEIAVCNLGSVNLTRHLDKKKRALDLKKIKKTVRTAVRMLDNVIDINYYSVPQARSSNIRHRPVGLGVMGFQDALYELRIPYGSDDAVAFADRSMEMISYCTIDASSKLAKERGSYASFEGSLWSRGILPLDSLKRLGEERPPGCLEADFSTTLDWDGLRDKVRKRGMRNSNVMAIAPTATIANVVGRVAVDRADLRKPVREIEPVRRVHGRQSLSCPRSQAARPVGFGNGERPQVLRRQREADRPRTPGSEGALRDGVRNRAAMDRRRREPAAEVDRPGAVPQPVYRRCRRQETRHHLPHGVAQGLEDHVLPAVARSDGDGEVDARWRGHIERGGCGRREDGKRRTSGMRHRRSGMRSMPVAVAGREREENRPCRA